MFGISYYEASEEESGRIYAFYGFAASKACLLELSMINALSFLELLDKRKYASSDVEWNETVDEFFKKNYKLTFSNLLRKLKSHLCLLNKNRLIMMLENCKRERDYLFHHFWQEHVNNWFTKEGREDMLNQLENSVDFFSKITHKLDLVIQSFADGHGLTIEIQQELQKKEFLRFVDSFPQRNKTPEP